MKKNKLLSLVIIILVLTVLMISCKQEPKPSESASQEPSDSASGSSSSAFKYTQAYFDSNTPTQYALSFDLVIGEGSSSMETMTYDIRIKEDMLYLKRVEEDTNITYFRKNASNTWYAYNTDSSSWQAVASDIINSYMESSLSYPNRYFGYHLGVQDTSLFTKGTGRTIAGVACEKYSYTYGSTTGSLFINPDTGYCFEVSFKNNDNPSINFKFTITSYSTTTVEYPTDITEPLPTT